MDEEVFLEQLVASERLPHWLQILSSPSPQPRYSSCTGNRELAVGLVQLYSGH